MANLRKPKEGEHNPYYQTYIDLVGDDAMAVLEQQQNDLANLLETVSEEELDYRYAEGKWSLREVLVHVLDTERIFAYRSLSVSRGEDRNHMGFDQNAFMDNSDWGHLTALDLLQDFNAVRSSTLVLFQNMSAEQVSRVGEVSGGAFMANSGAYIIAGHFAHHMRIIQERYLR